MNDTIDQLSKWGPEWLLIFALVALIGYLGRQWMARDQAQKEREIKSRLALAEGQRTIAAAMKAQQDVLMRILRATERGGAD